MGNRTLYLHVGQGKTGTSFIQATLAHAAQALDEAGIHYPDLRPAHRRARQDRRHWGTNGGNGVEFARADVDDVVPEGTGRILVSWEGFYRALAVDAGVEMRPDVRLGAARFQAITDRLRRFCARNDVGRVEIILFLRNPVGQRVARYLQSVKGQGATRDIEAAFAEAPDLSEELALLTRPIDLPDPHLHVFNYDVHKADLMAPIAGVLGVGREIFAGDAGRQVNRSLSSAEVEMALAWNESLGQTAAPLTVALCDEVPATGQARLAPSRAAQEGLMARLAGQVEQVNACLPEGERLWADYVEPPGDGEEVTVTRAYLRGLGRVVGQFNARQGVELQAFRTQNALLQLRCALLEKQAGQAGPLLEAARSEMRALAAMPGGEDKAADLAPHLERLAGAMGR
ncbi:hypothetical protein [Marinibacterium sp. SX1]|uniref:hypothetical protein n=1 Tax=Marinibacterium sp. SX1 TaxID=3388424 RepID=UPI003D163BD9